MRSLEINDLALDFYTKHDNETSMFDEVVLRVGDTYYEFQGLELTLAAGEGGPGIIAFVAGEPAPITPPEARGGPAVELIEPEDDDDIDPHSDGTP